MHEQMLMKYYIKYLKEIRGLSDSSIGHYTQAMRKISSFLVEKNMIQETVYEIQDIGELDVIKTYLYNNPQVVELDERAHRM